MLFPAAERVVYANNPLAEVICQLRFPPVLRIDAEIPAAFQDQIRGDYPQVPEIVDLQVSEGMASTPQEAANIIANNLFQSTRRISREFISADGKWKITLARDALTLTTTEYVRWEEFRERFERVSNVFASIYAPSFYNRLGLRYRNVIEKAKVGLSDKPWAEILRPELVGLLALQPLAERVTEAFQQFVIFLGDPEISVRLVHGLVFNTRTNNHGYLIDADFFSSSQTEVHNAFRVLDEFNRQSGGLFRWCIGDELHAAMGPRRADE